MKIAIIGAGAMGSIYGGHLSKKNEVYLIDKNSAVVDHINAEGLVLQERGQDNVYSPKAVVDTSDVGQMDLVILFVKALFSQAALEENKHIIGEKTYLMSLQNGAGHEEILGEFAPKERIIIGTTEDNGAILGPGYVRRGGTGKTNIGMIDVVDDAPLKALKEVFDACGFDTYIFKNIQQLIWDKLMVNVSLSAMTAVLQVKMGYIAHDAYALKLVGQLVRETIAVATAMGLAFDEEAVLKKVKDTSINSPEGITSICADILAGRRTEVETITGAVVKTAKKYRVEVPTHQMMLQLIHALEGRSTYKV